MSYANVSLKRRSFGETMRRDAWWLQPLVVFLGLSIFLVYSTWAALQGNSLLARSRRRELSFTALLAGNFRQLAARNFWSEA